MAKKKVQRRQKIEVEPADLEEWSTALSEESRQDLADEVDGYLVSDVVLEALAGTVTVKSLPGSIVSLSKGELSSESDVDVLIAWLNAYKVEVYS